MSFLENDTFSFWENDAISEIGTVLEIVPRLQNLGHMAGPHTGNDANHLGLPSDSAIGPSNLGPSDSQVGAIHWASPVSGRAGPDKIRPERRLLEAPMDRMRSYPLLLNSDLKASF